MNKSFPCRWITHVLAWTSHFLVWTNPYMNNSFPCMNNCMYECISITHFLVWLSLMRLLQKNISVPGVKWQPWCYNISYRTYCEFWKSPTSINFALASTLQPGWPNPSWLCGCAAVRGLAGVNMCALQGGDANKRLVNTAWVYVPRLSEPWKLDIEEPFRLDEVGKIQVAKQSAKLDLWKLSQSEPERTHTLQSLTFGDSG